MSGELTAGKRARLLAKKRGRLQISAVLPVIVRAAAKAAEEGNYRVDVGLSGNWFLDKTNQRDLRRALRQQELDAVFPRVEEGRLVMSICWGDYPPEDSLYRPEVVELGKPVLVVLNANSNTGKATLKHLQPFADLYDIRGTSRKGSPGDASLSHVKWLQGDFSADSLDQTLQGANKVFYIPPPVENRAELANNVAEAAARAGVHYVLDLSVVGAEHRQGVFANQMRDSEEAFESRNLNWAHLRTIFFSDNLFGQAQSIKEQGQFYFPMGEGGVALLAVDDIGRAAAKLLTRAGGERMVVSLTGPEVVSMAQVADTFSEVLGKRVEYVDVPPEATKETLRNYGMQEWFIEAMLELFAFFKSKGAEFVSPDGPKLLGNMLSPRDWILRNKAAFQ